VPAEGTKVKKGLRILVVVSKGREAGTVPDVKSLTERQARTELRKAGYTLGEVRKEFSDRVPADKVIDADPACGTAVSRETAIRLVISKGPHATSVEMPNIVGDAFDEAQKKIEAGGLHLGNVRYRSDPSLAANIVISQSIPPGERVPLETTVSVSVSKSE
jgi:serine/threonine-protein kinase